MLDCNHSWRSPALLALSLAVSVLHWSPGFAQDRKVLIPGSDVYPESITATSDGTLINGGLGSGVIYRTPPGSSTASAWIKAGTGGMMSVLGVLADDRSHTLYACSSDFSFAGVTIPGGKKPVSLMKFDLESGALKGSVPLPGDRTLCNDIVVGPDQSVYVTDSFNPHVLRLSPDGERLEVWATDPRFTVEHGAGLDGIALGSDGNVYVDLYNGDKLFRIAVNKDHSAGAVTELELSRPIDRPDALRRYGDGSLLMIEGGGRLDRVEIEGDRAEIETLKSGYDVPVSVVQVGHTAWVLEGQLDHLFNPKLGPPHPFQIDAVSLP